MKKESYFMIPFHIATICHIDMTDRNIYMPDKIALKYLNWSHFIYHRTDEHCPLEI